MLAIPQELLARKWIRWIYAKRLRPSVFPRAIPPLSKQWWIWALRGPQRYVMSEASLFYSSGGIQFNE